MVNFKILFVIISLYCYSKIIKAESKKETECSADDSYGLNTVVLECGKKVRVGILTKEMMTGAQVARENYTVANSPHPIVAFFLSIEGNVTIEENALSAFPNISNIKFTCTQTKGCNLHISQSEFKHVKFLEKITIRGVQISQNIIELLRSPKSLAYMDIELGELRSIKARMFGDLPMLSELWLRVNYIEEVDKDAFDGLPNLQKVTLSNNKLNHLPDGLFDKAKGLNHVYLDSNQFKNLNRSFCQGMKNVSYLSIAYNELAYLEPEALRELVNLTGLDVRNNQLAQLAPGQFNGTKLERVHLSGNRLKKIERTYFQGAMGVRILELSDNNITTIEAGAFEDLTNLTIIDLGCTHIKSLPDGIFNNTKALERITVPQWFKGKISRDNYPHCPNLTEIRFSRNGTYHCN